MPMLRAHRYTQVRKTRKTGAKTKVTDGMHNPWSQQDSGLTLSTSMGMGMIDVLEITLIVPTLRVGMPPRTLRVRS
ncbi:hypothetical protein AO390_21080 [Pseudomonas marginalis ICMP 11289]|nr:hypothetical protein AO390_21080 [Pseudomonas marginalis ICMP 11289]